MIAVVYLVWGPLGPSPLRRFVASYRRHRAGAEHDLVVILNGTDSNSLPALMAELEGVEHRTLMLKENVQDLTAYAFAAERLEHDRVCFLNSHSVLHAPDWLSKMAHVLDSPCAGLVGASGSWASMRSYALFHVGLPSPYGRIWRDRKATIQAFRELDRERSGRDPRGHAMDRVHTARALTTMIIGFRSFPAPHIRTNAFMAERKLLLRVLGNAPPRSKTEAHRIESGRASLTREVERAGLAALVVDRFGRHFEAADWPVSETFWQSDQRALLVSDNQTESYELGDVVRRRLLSAYAWGNRASPSSPAGDR